MLYKKYIKRVLDFECSLILLIITSPLMLTISVFLYWNNDRKIFFVQPRPGKDEGIFFIFKFKTMNDKRGENGELLPDNERISTIGRFLRKSSFDELPQLVNILKGDLSFIGPRPLLVEYLPLYNDFQKRRHEVRPGITGWAQINGRNTISWQEKFKYDVWYVDHFSFFIDLKILAMTLIKVIKSEGVNASDSSTMEVFNGNQ